LANETPITKALAASPLPSENGYSQGETFPSVNYGSQIRGFESGQTNATAPIMSIPRPKYTWFCLFNINPEAITSGFNEAVSTGKILASTKTIDHPQFSYNIEKMRNNNTVRNVPTRIEYKPISVGLFDDTTSHIAGMLKNYRNFYHYTGAAGSSIDFGDRLGENSREGNLPSVGMRVRPGARHFFSSISIFDLGTAPQSVNVYHIVNPVISDVTWDNLDYEDRSGKTGITLTLEYEGFYELIAEPMTKYGFIFSQIGKGGSSTSLLDAERSGAFDDVLKEDTLGGIFDQIGENLSRDLPSILSGGIQGGKINPRDLARGIFQSGAKGTPIQDVRNIITATKLGKQRAEQLDIVGILGAGRRIAKSVGNVGKIAFPDETVTGSDGKAKFPVDDPYKASDSSTDIMRGTIWEGKPWIIIDKW
jgi:hypothetical protein